MSDQIPSPPPWVPDDGAYGSPLSPGSVPPPGFPGSDQGPAGFGAAPVGFGGAGLPYGAFPVEKSTNAYAIVSLVLGLLSIPICSFGVLTGLAGVIFGIIGVVQANRDPERVGGKGLAIAGIAVSAIVGGAWLVFTVWVGMYG